MCAQGEDEEEGCGQATQAARIQWYAEWRASYSDEASRCEAQEAFLARGVGHYSEAMRIGQEAGRPFILRHKVQELLDACALYQTQSSHVSVEHAMLLIVALRAHAISLGSSGGGLQTANKVKDATERI